MKRPKGNSDATQSILAHFCVCVIEVSERVILTSLEAFQLDKLSNGEYREKQMRLMHAEFYHSLAVKSEFEGKTSQSAVAVRNATS